MRKFRVQTLAQYGEIPGGCMIDLDKPEADKLVRSGHVEIIEEITIKATPEMEPEPKKKQKTGSDFKRAIKKLKPKGITLVNEPIDSETRDA